MNRTKRETTKPERFSDIQLSMNKGVYHGWNDTYQRVYIKQENLINCNTNYSKPILHCGYKDDGFVVSDSIIHLEEYSSTDDDEEQEIGTDDEDDEEEEEKFETDDEEE